MTNRIQDKFKTYINAQLPRILTQMDRDLDSPTFGCFDRNYWHYKIRDFPSSILQQGVFTLEAMRTQQIPGVAVTPKLEEWCVAAVQALGRQVDIKGRVDEYYPFEESYPAAAFGLSAICRVLWDWQQFAPHLFAQVDLTPITRLAQALAMRQETQATNQQAAGLAGLALAVKLKLISPTEANVDKLATDLFASQHDEGWFDEYGGPDFGYLTVTIDALVDYFDATSDKRALIAIDKAVDFLVQLVGVDGCLPSTLNSRNTDYVVPYGLVRTAARNPLATWLVETLFKKIDSPQHFLWATDDRYHLHYIYASVVRCLPFLSEMKAKEAPKFQSSLWLAGCGFWKYSSLYQEWTIYVGANKGGLVRIHRQEFPPVVDHGWRIYQEGRIWTNNWWSNQWEVKKEDNQLKIEGECQKTKFHTPSPYKHFVLRVLSFALRARVIPLLKRIMIFQPKGQTGVRFERVVEIQENGIQMRDSFSAFKKAIANPSPRQNLRHVASADSFHLEELSPTLLEFKDYSLDSGVSVASSWNIEELT